MDLPPAPTEAPPPWFCGACGAALPEGSPRCTACTGQPAPPGPLVHTTRPLRAALLLYFAILACVIAGAVAMLMQDDPDPATFTSIEIFTTVALSAVVAVACLVGRHVLRAPLSTPARPIHYIAAVFAGCVTCAVAVLLTTAIQRLVGVPDEDYSTPFLEAGYAWPFIILNIAVQPAVFEELAFRGLVGAALDRSLASRDALIVTAMLFAILHLSPISLPHLFLVGLALGLLRRWSGSLYPCMLLHFTHNGLVLLLEYLGY